MKTWQEVYDGLQPIEHDIVNQLGEICTNLKPQRILEIGSGWGMSTRAFIQYAPTAHILTIDKIPAQDRRGYLERVDGVKEHLQEIIGDSKVLVPKIKGTFDLVYIDGSHDYIDVVTDLRNSLGKVTSGGTIMMDDVFHAKNKGGEYGVLEALREVVMENYEKHLKVYIMAVGHGQAVLHL